MGGGTAGVVDYANGLYSEFPRALALIWWRRTWCCCILFRSVVLPLKALLMNTLSILASYGALVVVFQDGALAGLLNFEPLGFIEASLPIVMFCVLFGLSMDYEVFLLSRIKEAYDDGARQLGERGVRPGTHGPSHHQRGGDRGVLLLFAAASRGGENFHRPRTFRWA